LLYGFCLLLAIGACLQMFILKYRVIAREEELKEIHTQVKEDIRAIHMLEAEWAVKNDPNRLIQLAATDKKMQPIQPAQVRLIEDLPNKFVPPPSLRPSFPTEEQP